jgi:nitroreductase
MTTTLQQDPISILKERHAVKKYDSKVKMSKQEIKELIDLTQSAPSSWNLQHWKFLVFEDQAAKEKLLPIAYGQQQIVQASIDVAILGDLEANKNAEAIYTEAVKKGYMTQEIKNTLIQQIERAYQNPQVARDQAVLNASLAAMQLMLSAKAMGYDSCPMGGFDVQKLVEAFQIPPRYIPIMLISIGKAAQPAYPSTRFPAEQVTIWNTF